MHKRSQTTLECHIREVFEALKPPDELQGVKNSDIIQSIGIRFAKSQGVRSSFSQDVRSNELV